MFTIFVCASLVACLQAATMEKAVPEKQLTLSEFQNDLEYLNSEVDTLKLDTEEIRSKIAELNDTLIVGNHQKDNTDCGTLENGNDENTENVMGDCFMKEKTNEDKIRQLIKAFHDEKKLYRQIVSVGNEFQDTLQREVNTAIDKLKEKQMNESRDLQAKLNDLEHRLEECAAQRLDISRLESEIIAVRNDSELEVMQQKEQYAILDDKLELFNRNTSESFITMDEFAELQTKYSGQADLHKLVSQCDGSWVFDYQLQSCFLFVTKERSWGDAATFCENHGGRLVQIENKEKYIHVKQMYEESGRRWGEGWKSFWAGGSDINTEGSWEWKDDRQIFSYTRWENSHSEPNGGTSENCLAVLLSVRYFDWNDGNCADRMPFICEKFPMKGNGHEPIPEKHLAALYDTWMEEQVWYQDYPLDLDLNP